MVWLPSGQHSRQTVPGSGTTHPLSLDLGFADDARPGDDLGRDQKAPSSHLEPAVFPSFLLCFAKEQEWLQAEPP